MIFFEFDGKDRSSLRVLHVDLVVSSTAPGGEDSVRRKTDAVGLGATRQACFSHATRLPTYRRLPVQEQSTHTPRSILRRPVGVPPGCNSIKIDYDRKPRPRGVLTLNKAHRR